MKALAALALVTSCVTPAPAPPRPAITLEGPRGRVGMNDVEDPREREDLWRFAEDLGLAGILPEDVVKACRGRVEGMIATSVLTIGGRRLERYHGCLEGSALLFRLDSFMIRLRAATHDDDGGTFACRVKNDPRCKLHDAARSTSCLKRGETGTLYAAVSYLGGRFLTNDFVWLAKAPYARRQKIEACFRDELATLEVPFETVPGYRAPLNAWLSVPLR